ncbi:MAG: hypothetical protein A2Y61_01730 [Chloroflexi bacterium RBG_13_60_13]|nr:MAG: hypothetical protein A2Y61_01730 [Chloroflexi bacterium RBG_13_60_13]
MHGHIVVSMPPTIPHLSVRTLAGDLADKFRRRVLIVTNNVSFVRLERLSEEEAKVLAPRHGFNSERSKQSENGGRP